MMRKCFLCILCYCMVCGLVACGSTAYKNEDLDFVKVINASTEEIYGIGYTYYVDEKVVRSGGGCNADNSVISKKLSATT